MLHGREVHVGYGDMEYFCTIISGCTGSYPFLLRCNASGAIVHGFTASEAKMLRRGELPGCELV